MDRSGIQDMFKESKVLTLERVSRENNCSIRTVQRHFAKLPVLRSYSKNSRYYTLSDIPVFNAEGIWGFRDILFSKYGNLKATVKHLIVSSERGLGGNEIGKIVQLSPRSFMNHFRELEGVLREKHDGAYVYFSKNPSKYAKQSSNRAPVGDAGKSGDATAVKILVEYIRLPAISTEELSDLLRQRKGCRVSASEIENFLAFHGLLKKKARCEAIRVLLEMRRKRSEDMNPKRLFPAVPELSFHPEKPTCSRCGNEMNVLKTAKRTAVTMGIGKFVARETHLGCPRCRETVRCEDLRRLVSLSSASTATTCWFTSANHCICAA